MTGFKGDETGGIEGETADMKLSIVTICYNSENCIEKTIRSVLNQTVPVYEYIIIDGGSSDNTMRIVDSFKDEFERRQIRYMTVSEKDNGISDAFNKGIARATGDLIGLINSDDELSRDANAVLQREYEEEADVYYGNIIWNDPANRLRFVSKPKVQNPQELGRLMYEMVMIHPATFVTKKAYDQYGVFDVSFRYCMDEELLYRFYKAGARFKYVDCVLAVFQAGGVSDSNPVKVFKETSRIPLMYGEPSIKVKCVETKQILRDRLSRIAKMMGLYKIMKKQV